MTCTNAFPVAGVFSVYVAMVYWSSNCPRVNPIQVCIGVVVLNDLIMKPCKLHTSRAMIGTCHSLNKGNFQFLKFNIVIKLKSSSTSATVLLVCTAWDAAFDFLFVIKFAYIPSVTNADDMCIVQCCRHCYQHCAGFRHCGASRCNYHNFCCLYSENNIMVCIFLVCWLAS